MAAADSFMASKPKQHRLNFPKQAVPFFAFLLSAFFYISIFFYLFNLSLSTLFYNTKFWFCISNTLIFIIAADYGVFSPSKHRLDRYDDYECHILMQIQKTNNINTSYSLTSPRLDQNPMNISIPKQEKELAVVQENQNPEDEFQIIIEGRDETQQMNRSCEQTVEIPARTYRRSKSEKAKRSVLDESKSETGKHEEENEFSRMTDEELNRRVEEFILRCNREMRLQAAPSKTNPS